MEGGGSVCKIYIYVYVYRYIGKGGNWPAAPSAWLAEVAEQCIPCLRPEQLAA